MKCAPQSIFLIIRGLIIFFLLGAVLQGQVAFSTPPTYAGSGFIFVADFNGDGKSDILAADGTLSLGNGDGTFRTGTAVTGQPVAVADFNGDGKPDVLELSIGSLEVLQGNGDGTFQAPINTNIGATLTAVAVIDLNADGKADVVGIFNNTLRVYLANGDGTFAAGVSYSLGAVQIFAPTLIVFGDFNGDHKTDVAVLSPASSSVAAGQEIVLLGNGDGTFQSTPINSSAAVGAALSVVVGDFNGDGKLDIATSELVVTGNTGVATVFLQLGNGDGTFQAPTTACTGPYNYGGPPENIALETADVNGDGKLDLVLTGDLIGVYLGNGDGTFSNPPNYYQPMSSGSAGIAIADFNSDGKPDIAADGEVLLGNGNGRFQGPPTVLLPSYAGIAVVVKFVKNTAPGIAAIPNNAANTLYILTNDGTGILSLAHTYSLPQAGYVIASADLNGDGYADLVVEGEDPTSRDWSYMVLLGNGDGSFQPAVLHQQPTAATNLSFPIVIADFNNDHKPDLAFSQGSSTFAVLLGNGDGTFGSATYVFDGDGGEIVSGDFNNDGNLDIAETGPSGVAIVLGTGNGAFGNATFPSTVGLGKLIEGDLNGDGNADLVGTAAGIQVLLGNGNGTFNALAPFDSNGQVSAFALADFDGDGKLDVLTSEGVGAVTTNSIFLGNGDGTFNPTQFNIPYNYPPHSLPPNVQVADMNGDGKPDLIIESGISTIFVLLNSTVPVPPDFTFAMASGASNSSTIAAGQTATFNLALTPARSFTGTVNLTCSVTPTVTPTPLCSVPGSVNLAGGAATPVTVTFSTTASSGTGGGPSTSFPTGIGLFGWTLVLFASGLVFLATRFRRPTVALPMIVVSLILMVGCGGSSSSSSSSTHTVKGTPAGTYTATITATSGSLSHQVVLNVIVQ